MGLKDKLKNSVKGLNRKVLISLVAGGLTLVAVTALKDNVHLGAVTLNNPQENHYAWGLWPTIKIKGENSKGNFRSYGLLAGVNKLGHNSKLEGDMKGYGLIAGGNELGDNSKLEGDMKGYGLILGINKLGDNSKLEGDMKSYALIASENKLEHNSSIKGNAISRGIISMGPRDTDFLTNVEINMNYTHHTEPNNLKEKNND